MKKIKLKGFTLIELLATIVILALVFAIAIGAVYLTKDKTNEQTVYINKNSILSTADTYVTENSSELEWQSDNTSCITIRQLINKGFFKSEDVEQTGYKEYSIKVIEESPKVYNYELIDDVYCNIRSIEPPIINFDGNIEKQCYESFDLWSDVTVEGTEIIEKSIFLSKKLITNSNQLEIGEHTVIYYAKNILEDEVNKERNIKIIGLPLSINVEEDIEKNINESFDLWSDVVIDGEQITEKKITVNGNKVTNTNELEVGEYVAIYYVKNICGTEATIERTIKIASVPPTIIVGDDITKFHNENFDLWSDTTIIGDKIKEKTITINGNKVTNTNELEVGDYEAIYYIKNTYGDEVTAKRKIKIVNTKKNYECTEKEEEYVIPVSGYYNIIANGAQGSNNGGLGGNVYGKMYFKKDEVLKINVGCTNGYNGGGVNKDSEKDLIYSSGGGATTIKNNSSYVLIAAGGGGNIKYEYVNPLTESSNGGTGNGKGAVNGTNGGGGAASMFKTTTDGETCVNIPNSDYKCEFGPDEIIVVCKQYNESCTTPPKYCVQYGNGQTCIMGNICFPSFDCIKWSDTTPQCYPNPQAGCAVEETIIMPGEVTCNNALTEVCYPNIETTNGNPGNGGTSSVIDSAKKDFNFMSGQQEGNGNLSIEYVGEVK